MALKAIYNKQDEIPEKHRELYTERDGKWELTGIEGVKTQADVDRVTEALRKQQNDNKELKTQLKEWTDLESGTAAEVRAKLEQIPELEIKAQKGGVDDEKVKKLVDARVATEKQPLERELKKIQGERDTLAKENGELKTKDRRRTIHDAVRSATTKAKVVDTAVEDVLLYAEAVFDVSADGKVTVKENVGFTPGITPDEWLGDMQDRRPHWWPPSQGGGSSGGNGGGGIANNPWSRDSWNLTAQGAYLQQHGEAKAESAAKAAGSFLGATTPPAAKK